jgi:hypothetical protein
MQFSEARRSYLAHQIVAALLKEGLAEIDNERLAMNRIKAVLEAEHGADDRVDAAVRKKIASLSRNVPQGSREWDVLYRQYFEEESNKLKPRGA